jgi:type I restriction enzyme, S subunit
MSFQRYARYKDCGVEWLGQVPEHWQTRRLRFLVEIRKRIVGELGPDILSITQQGIKVRDVDSNDGQVSMDYSKYQIVEPGDFAMNHMDLLTGYVDISAVSGVTSPDYRVFSTLSDSGCKDKYLLYVFQNGYKRKIFYAFGQGSSQFGRWRLPTEAFNDFSVPLPPPQEQWSIVMLIESETAKTDALIEEQRRLIELLKAKRQSVISHAVTKGLNHDLGTANNGAGALEPWSAIPLKRLCSLLKDGTHLPPDRVDAGIPLLSVRNLVDGRFVLLDDDSMISEESYRELSRSYVPEPGDVLLAIVGATLGKTAIVPQQFGPFHIQRSVAIFRPRPLVLREEFLYYCFQSSPFQSLLWKYTGFSAQPGIYLGTLQNFRIVIPPIAEQIAIVEYLKARIDSIDKLIKNCEMAISLLQERRSSLISSAVTGKIDVRSYTPKEAA